MNLPIAFSTRAGETYNANITQLNARWGRKFVEPFEQKVAKTVELISESPNLNPFYPVVGVITAPHTWFQRTEKYVISLSEVRGCQAMLDYYRIIGMGRLPSTVVIEIRHSHPTSETRTAGNCLYLRVADFFDEMQCRLLPF